MKKYKDISLNVRIPLMLGLISLILLAVVCIALMMPLRSNALQSTSTIAQLTAEETGQRLTEKINGVANVVRAYTAVFEHVIESKAIPKEKKREFLLQEMNRILKKEKKLTNIWCTLEPNALDGMDSFFVDREDMGSNSEGIFDVWIADGELTVSEGANVDDYYLIPQKTGREFISEPYWDEVNDEKVHMFSISFPIMVNNQFKGVIGIDFDVAELNDMIEIYSRGVVGKLVTDKGTIAVYHDFEQIGQPAEKNNREILDKLSLGKMIEGRYQSEEGDVYKVYSPVKLGESGKIWFYAVDIPFVDVYSEAHKTAIYLIVYFLIGVLLIALSGWFLMKPMLKGVTVLTGVIRKLSLGHINLQIDDNSNKDEIGTMKNELGKLLEGLKNSVGFAQKIGEGNLTAEFHLLSDDDALGNSLLEMRTSLQKAGKEQKIRAEEENQRSWGTAGLAKFAEILRQDNNNMETLSYNVISNLVKYLNVNQGGIFVMNEAENEEDRVLEMKACYAFDRKKFADKKIYPGEGLVGTCYLEGEPIYLTKVPNDYIVITSGLGDANPKAIFICPLKVNDQIFGVIELASFQPFEPYQLDFIQKVSESIASTIATVNVNIRTSRLLAQTKLQTEEMANQEEELRQNMEEMQATQEESRRRESELQEILAKTQEVQAISEEKEYEMQQFSSLIFNTFSMVDISAKGIITDVNQNLLNIFKSDKSVFVGKLMSTFIGAEPFNKAWSELAQGKYYEEVLNMDSGDGKVLIIRHKFMPICNKHGELKRVLLFAIPENSVVSFVKSRI